jgi:hypothetical protein
MSTPITVELPESPPPPPQQQPRNSRFLLIVLLIVVAIVAAAVLIAILTRGARQTATNSLSANAKITAPLGGRSSGEFDLASGVTIATIRTANLGGDLYQITSPARLSVDNPSDGPVTVGIVSGGPAAVTILLSSKVTWKLAVLGGASRVGADLRAGAVSGVAFDAGASEIEVWLPRTDKTLPVREAGGASVVSIHGARGVPARVRFGSGAGSASVDDQSRSGISGGTVITSPGFSTAGPGYDIDAAGGVSTLRLDRY